MKHMPGMFKKKNINGIVAALCADVTYNTWMLAKIMEIVAAIPDAHLHLRQQVRACVCLYAELLYVLQLEYIYRLSYLNLFLY